MYQNTDIINGMINAVIMQFLATVVAYISFKYFLDVKKSGQKALLFTVIFKFFAFNLVVTFLRYQNINEETFNSAMFITNTIALIILFAGLKLSCGLSYLHICFANFISDISGIVFLIIPYMLFSTAWENNIPIFVGEDIEIYKMIIFLLMILFVVVSLCFMHWIYKKIGNKFANSNLKYKGLLWGMVLLEYVVGNVGYATDDLIGAKGMLLYYGLGVGLGVLFLYELSLWMRKRKERQIQQENHILSIENAVMKEYYETLEYQLERTRKFRHDIDKHMTVIKEMLKTKEKGGEIINYASNVQSEYQNLKPIEYCRNPVVNAILVNKVRQCEEMEIETNIDISRFELGGIKETDIIAVLANVLDNAIEECSGLTKEDKLVELKCNVYAENLIIKVSNSTEKREISIDGIKTTKKDVYAHGVGISIVKEIVDKYNGTLELDVKDDMFNVIIGMNVNE